MAVLPGGRYAITNVRFNNAVTLRDGNQGSDLVAGADNDIPGALVRHAIFGRWINSPTALVVGC